MQSLPTITRHLLVINALMFFALLVGERWGVDLNDLLGLHFVLADDFRLYQLFTYMFMHANGTHLFFNMFMFWMFGRTMENVWGARKFLLFYIVCGLGAGVLQEVVQLCQYYVEGLQHFSVVSDGMRMVPMATYLNQWTTVGASGAIYGILLGFGMTFPNERILLLIPPIPIKAKYMVIASAVIELLLGMNPQGSNVAHFAHLGGMLFGWLLILYWRKQEHQRQHGFISWQEYRPKREPAGERVRSWWNRQFRKDEEPRPRNIYANDRETDHEYNAQKKQKQAEVDRILEKIKRSGYESLTADEKRALFDAGRK